MGFSMLLIFCCVGCWCKHVGDNPMPHCRILQQALGDNPMPHCRILQQALGDNPMPHCRILQQALGDNHCGVAIT
jgi:hypothetical protein